MQTIRPSGFFLLILVGRRIQFRFRFFHLQLVHRFGSRTGCIFQPCLRRRKPANIGLKHNFIRLVTDHQKPLHGIRLDRLLARVQALLRGDRQELLEQGVEGANQFAESSRVIAESAAGAAQNAGEAAIVLLAPDGAIRAFAGGRDYATSQFNRAIQAQRQPGSAFKPFVFTAALEAGYDPSSAVWDEPIDLEGWTPQNFSGGFRGLVTLQEALKRSINTVAAQVADQVGIARVVEVGRRFGLTSPLPELPAIALGAAEVNLLELTSAYAVFANDGARREPYFITSITNSRGDVLYEHAMVAAQRATTAETARAMSTMLQDVVLTGTGRRVRLGDRPAAGKTGTSQSFRDAWFVGYTADYIAGVWVGNDDDTPMDDVTGGGLPATIWQRYMTTVHADLPVRALSAPAPRTRSEREERLAAFYSDLSASFSAILAEEPSPNER